MKTKTFIVIAAAVAIGYLFTKDKVRKEVVKRLVKQNVFEKYNEKNIYSVNICALNEEEI